MKLLILREKHENEYWLCDTTQSLFDTALAIVSRRFDEGYWYEGEDAETAARAVDEKDGKLAWWLMQKRQDHEYEGFDISDLRSVGGVLVKQTRMLSKQLAYTRAQIEPIRLAAEANAVLDRPGQIAEMAESMDLTPEEVQKMLDVNELKWELIKNAVVAGDLDEGGQNE
jgi:hypothetical protein